MNAPPRSSSPPPEGGEGSAWSPSPGFLAVALGGVAGALALARFQCESWTTIAMVAAVFIVGQMLESNVLTPRLVGGRIGLHPVWVVFALLGGGLLFGFLGVLLAVPAAAVIGVLVRFAIAQYRQSPLYRGSGASGPDS